MSDNASDGWTPVPGFSEPLERFELADLDLLAEATHVVRGPILRRLKQPRSVAELAGLMDVPITRLYHHVNRLADLGLIRVVATRQVAAVTERRYQVAGKSFTVAPELLESTDEREVSAALSSLFDEAKLRFQRFVESVGVHQLDEGDSLAELSLGELRLSRARRDELVQAITTLIAGFVSDVDDDDPDGITISLFVAAFEEPS